jgi:6-pyruvoyltetrahydropterin/6-carboxytetrahydropterin synthase
MYQSSKRYGHEQGFSCAFRQWKAHSHCSKIHGYPLAFEFVFESDELDRCGWVVDFGGLKSLKGILESTFDHKTIVAQDDPELEFFKDGEERKIFDLVILPATGCEKFSEYVFNIAEIWLKDAGFAPRVMLVSVKVSEHGGNSATYINPKLDIKSKLGYSDLRAEIIDDPHVYAHEGR